MSRPGCSHRHSDLLALCHCANSRQCVTRGIPSRRDAQPLHGELSDAFCAHNQKDLEIPGFESNQAEQRLRCSTCCIAWKQDGQTQAEVSAGDLQANLILSRLYAYCLILPSHESHSFCRKSQLAACFSRKALDNVIFSS